MGNSVRVQIQGKKHIGSVVAKSISADDAIAALEKQFTIYKDEFGDPDWKKNFLKATKAAIVWVEKIKKGGGYVPRKSGHQKSFDFEFKREDYRVDVECKGSKEAEWFE
jgi:hypothetical protein